MSLSQSYPSTFSATQETQEVLKNHENEVKKIYNDINAFLAANGHAHTGIGTDGAKVGAANVVNTPAGNIAAVTVQAALDELDTEKFGKSLFTAAGQVPYGTGAGTLAMLSAIADKHLMFNAAGNAIEGVTPYKIGSFTRNMTAANGTQALTGIGFKPSAVVFIAEIAGGFPFSIGMLAGTDMGVIGTYGANLMVHGAAAIYVSTSISDLQVAKISSYDSDGITLSWEKNGSPSGTITVYFLALR